MSETLPIPHNLDAEKAVLGAILIQPEFLDQAAAILQPAAFYRHAHQQIFAAMLALQAERVTVDFVTLKTKLDMRGELGDVGGPAYLSALSDGTPHGMHVEQHAKLVREAFTRRQLLALGSQLMTEAAAGEGSALDVIADVDGRLMQLAADQVTGDLVPMSALMRDLFPVLEDAYKNQRAITGLPTPWRELDELTLGLHPGTLIYLAGQTSQGKSSLGLNLAVDVAKHGQSVAVFSLEDSRDQIALRALSAQAGVSLFRMKSGFLKERDWAPLSHAYAGLVASHLWIDDSPRLTPQELRAKCRRLQSTQGLALVVVDYVQLITAAGRHENRTREVGVISAALKQIAKELKVPVVACCQLNRETSKEVRRPRLSDLRESGNLEQDADLVWLIYRDPNAEDDGQAELIVAKQKNGPTGTVKLRFERETFRFMSWKDEEMPVQREFSR